MKQKVITVKSWNGTEFYFDQWKGTFIQYDNVDLTSINFNCDETDMESAERIALQEGFANTVELIEINYEKVNEYFENQLNQDI